MTCRGAASVSHGERGQPGRPLPLKVRVFPREASQFDTVPLAGTARKQDHSGLQTTWIEQHLGWTTQGVQRHPRRIPVAAHVKPAPRPVFTVLPRRCVVERASAWLGRNRRLSKDHARLCETSETMA